jgi:hypothetical protein
MFGRLSKKERSLIEENSRLVTENKEYQKEIEILTREKRTLEQTNKQSEEYKNWLLEEQNYYRGTINNLKKYQNEVISQKYKKVKTNVKG